ncbi:hypothetical protein FACS1894166_02930 [Bacilli bacterium]|nr:hypothetical protein FACS1894166_02930 [Bacilli bacterium]
MGRKIAFIESERFQAMLHKTNAHHLTISEKLKAIKYARKYGFVRANNKTNISLGLLTKWVEQYKNNQLGFNPDLQATRQISQISARVNDIQWMLWGDKTKLLQLLDIEDKVYGHPSD